MYERQNGLIHCRKLLCLDGFQCYFIGCIKQPFERKHSPS